VPANTKAFDHRRSLGKGLVVNLLNPHPYVFWTVAESIGAAVASADAWLGRFAFVSGFYGCLVGSKLLLALLIHSGRARLQGRGYRLALQASGGLLFVFALLLIWSGGQQL
jgi:threonine/homoserine/homoserine lactone efflux protein